MYFDPKQGLVTVSVDTSRKEIVKSALVSGTWRPAGVQALPRDATDAAVLRGEDGDVVFAASHDGGLRVLAP